MRPATHTELLLSCCRHLANIAKTQLLSFVAELNCVDKSNKTLLPPYQRTLREKPKTNFGLIIYSPSSKFLTHPRNLAKIGPLDVEIIDLTEIVKINK